MMRTLLLLLLLIPIAHSQTYSPTWHWVAPTQCADGTPATNCVLTKYTLYTGLQGQPKTAWGVIAPTALSISTGNTSPGIWCGQVSASSAAGESALSKEACITLAPNPGAPTNPTVTLTTTSTIAYGLMPSNDRLAFLIVGSVPLGTPCVLDQVANTYHVVPRGTVTFDKPYKPTTVTTVFAVCSG